VLVTRAKPAVERLSVTCLIGPSNVDVAESGPTRFTMSVRVLVVDSGLPISPTIETRAISAGNRERRP
jgi:hypothetical protein